MNMAMEKAREVMKQLLRDPEIVDRLLPITRMTMELTEGWDAGKYDDSALREALRGFVAVLLEAIEGKSTELRGFFMETTLPAFLEAGQSGDSLVKASATYVCLVAAELAAAAPPELRANVLSLGAVFAGTYVQEVCQVVSRSRS